MSIRALEGQVLDHIPVDNVLVSVFDKTGLDVLVHGLTAANPKVRFLSTGGTYTAIQKMLGDRAANNLVEVATYTGFPEMDGGLVKTLHPKIHAGILGERGNQKHQEYLRQTLNGGVFIDMVVVNAYPFEQMVSKIRSGEIDPRTGQPFNFENARGNIDIGGPTIIRAAAKNFPSCAVVCDPNDYQSVVEGVTVETGCTTFAQRARLVPKVFELTARYDTAVAAFMSESMKDPRAVRSLYKFGTE
ncbi:MAG: hypothetical protein AABX10_04840 [Nanoarchaeota archaeon]